MVRCRSKKLFTMLNACVLVMLLGACTGKSSASGTEEDLVFSHAFPANHIFETNVVQQFKSETEEATDGTVMITSFPGNQLADTDGHYEAAVTGISDMGFSVHSYTPNQFPLTSVMELPFISDKAVDGSKILWQLYQEFPALQEEHGDVVPLWLSTSEAGQLFTVGKQVKTPEDLQGMQIRSPSQEANRWLEELGATPVSMPMNDVYEALERGVVDGTVAPPHTLLDYSLQEVIDYVTVGNFYMTTFYGVMSESAYESMNHTNQNALDQIRGEYMSSLYGEVVDERSKEAVQAAEEAGAEFYEISEEELDVWEEKMAPATESWIEDKESKGLPGQKVYDRAIELSNQ
ncbi:TRAP transporter substrate-binding protein [Aquibacillus sediminis]|uniref:TRAP transporter substrate-binding protein n=1 Tax=Aquibacillus sediminis TaxID=2574734 RepID=UPI00110896E6|nr:TRAP transporter substrate-binding protein [Aquibacillus sediminis]